MLGLVGCAPWFLRRVIWLAAPAAAVLAHVS